MPVYPNSFRLWCILLFITAFIAAFALRCSAIFLSSDALTEDPDAYRALAITWRATGTFGLTHPSGVRPTAFRPPLYPATLALLVHRGSSPVAELPFHSVALLHAALGALTSLGTAICFYIWTGRWGSDSRLSRWRIMLSLSAGLWVTLDPILVRQSQLIMTETLATFLTVLTMLGILVRSSLPISTSVRWPFVFDLSLGILFGLQSLCRPTAIAWLLLWLAGVVLISLSNAEKSKNPSRIERFINLRGGMSMILGCLTGWFLVLLPWGLRNLDQSGVFRVTTTHGGYTLLLANNPSLYDHFQTSWSRSWDEAPFFEKWAIQKANVRGEQSEDELAQSLAWHTIRNRPAEFARACVIRIGWLWALWPNQSNTMVQLGIGIWYGVLYLLALIGCYRLLGNWKRAPSTRHGTWLMASILLSVTLVHSVYWSNMRMRSVCIPSLAMLASLPFLPPRLNENTTPGRI